MSGDSVRAALAAELELVAVELRDERDARLIADNRIAELEDAIREHRAAIYAPHRTGNDADRTLWKVLS